MQLNAASSSLADAQARADAGILRVTMATERTDPGWIDDALRLIRERWHPTAEMFTMEQVRMAVAPLLPQPSDQRIWGAVTRAAMAENLIVRVPGHFAPAISSNGSPKPLYRFGRQA